jgi:DNA repair exonuclease SbcCD ATPase subunit
MADDEEVSIDEFLQVNTKLLSIGAEIDELKGKLRELDKTEPTIDRDIESCEKELSEVESARELSRTAHLQSLAVVQEELSKLRKEMEDGAKREQDRVAELTTQIGALTKKIENDDQKIENLKEKLTADDQVIQRKATKFYGMLLREQAFRPYVDFLRVSRSLPMYLEDLGGRITSLRAGKGRVDATIRELTGQVNELRATHKSIKAQLRAKHQDLNGIHAQGVATQERLVNAGTEIENTQKAVTEANQRLELAKQQALELITQRETLEEQLAAMRKKFDEELAEIDRSRAEIEASLREMQTSKDQELNACNDRIQAIRKRLTYIKEKDNDPEVPRVDVDLQRQIERVRVEKAGLVHETQSVLDETKRLEVQLQQKTWDLQTLALKTQPTQALLGSAEFQQKFLLLKELVLQNMGLRDEVTRMTGRILELRQENDEIRRKLEGQ